MTGLVGQTLDHFRLLEQIGQGGMATVFRAQDTLTQSVVAVKVLSPTISGDRKFVKRFRREAEIARKLQHPNILPVIHYGQARGSVYLVMPFVPGRTLQDHLSRRALTPAESARWIAQVCEALDFAHRKGVIHRDVKPSNIMIDQQGNARLMDFGLARMVEGTSTLTGSMLMGTPAYVSPEQGRGLPVDARTDQYALGVILFQIAVGRLPFDADTPMGTVLMHIQDSIPRPRQLNPEISPALEAVILKSLSKDRTKRFPSAAALNRAYQSALAGVVPPGVEIAGVVPQGSTQALGAARAAVGPLASSPRRRLGPGFWLGLGVPVLVVLVGVLALPSILDALGGGPRPAASPTVQSLATLPPVEPLPTATVAPATPTATPVVSAECPGLRLIGFQRAGSGVEWIIDNGLAAPARLLGLEYQGPIDNYPVALWLGEAAVWEIPVGATPEPGAAITIPQDDRSLLAAGATRRLRLVFPIEDHQPVYSMVLIFDGACSLPTGW